MPQIKMVSRWMAECLSIQPITPQISYPILLLMVECITNKDDFEANNSRSRIIDETLAFLIKFESLRARQKVSDALSNLNYGPAQTISLLAQDLDIDVAGPILRKCHNVSEEDLLLVAKTRSLLHVIAVLERKNVNNTVLSAVKLRIEQEKLSCKLSPRYRSTTVRPYDNKSSGQLPSDRRTGLNIIRLSDYK